MPYVEEREFTFCLALRAEFPEEYEGEEDGYAWVESFQPMAGDMLRAIVDVVSRYPGWSVRPANRGRSTEEEVFLILERTPGA